MKRYVNPNCCCRSWSRLTTCAWIETSSAETGSSATMNSAPMASARAMPTRWHCPPESEAPRRPASSAGRPTRAISARTWPAISPGGQSRWTRNTSERVSATVRRGFSEAKGSWNTICARRRKPSRAPSLRASTSSPAKRTRPPEAGVRRSSARPSVLLPQPLSPTRPNVPPFGMAKLTPLTARVTAAGRRARRSARLPGAR